MNRGGNLKRTPIKRGCGKVRYRDELAAKLALAKIEAADDCSRPKSERRAYPCTRCAGWHLTSWKRGVPAKTSPRDTGPSRKVRLLVLERDGYSCVCCGRSVTGQAYSLQHRKRRSQGGNSLPANLLTVLGDGTAGCHQRIDSRIDPHDEARGFTVRSGQDPALIPVMIHGEQGGALLYLTDDGRYSAEAPERAA